VTWRWTLNL
jgi:hypothetical protein